MIKAPILTIGIPVYNGERTIGSTLESIFADFQLYSLVEVVISDNFSTDKTWNVVSNFVNRYPNNIRYICNLKNEGFDVNLDLLAERARGDYLWFLGCGEKIAPGAMSHIISKVEHEKFDNIVLNFDVFDDTQKKLSPTLSHPLSFDRTTESCNDFSFPRYSPAVSANIVCRKKWIAVSRNPLLEVGWCHVERVLDIIGGPLFEKSLFISAKCFTLFRDADGWWTKKNSFLLTLALKHIQIIRSMPKRGFTNEASINLEDKLNSWSLLRAVLQSKSFGMKLNFNLLKSLAQMFAHKFFFWAIVFPALFIPSPLLIYARKFRRNNCIISLKL